MRRSGRPSLCDWPAPAAPTSSEDGETPTNLTITGARAQLADSDEAVLRFAVTTRRPDRDVHPGDGAWWLATEKRLEIRHELRASACSR